MAQAALDSLPQSTLEEKFSALEARFGALEKKYHDLHERTFTLTENSTGESTEVAIPKVSHRTSNEDIFRDLDWADFSSFILRTKIQTAVKT